MPTGSHRAEAIRQQREGIAELVDPQPPPSPSLLRAARALQELGRWIVCSEDDPRQISALADALEALARRACSGPARDSRWLASERGPQERSQPNARGTHPLLGSVSPVAPPLALRLEGDRVVAEVCFDARFEGNRGWAHGGFIAAGFDILLVQAARLSGRSGPTGTLSVRFVAPTPTGQPLRYAGWFEREEGRKLIARGELRARDGSLLAEAEAILVAPP